MSQIQTVTPASQTPSLPAIAYKGTPVLTSELLAQAYEVKLAQIQQNYANNKGRFVEGKHFFLISGKDLKTFKNSLENFESVQIDKRTPSLTLWTERGAARHAKMLNSDRAWDVFELLEETFFRVVKAEPVENLDKLPSPDAPITPADQSTLQAIVKAKVEALPRDRRGGLYPQIWSRFNNHFRLARYCQLPQSRMSEAVTYLTQLDVAENGRALPASASAPTELSFRSDLPADMDAGRKDALKKIQHLMNGIAAARDVVSMFCYPAPSVMNTSAKRPLTYAARHDFYAAALDCLSAAHAALEAGYRLNRLHE